MPGSTQDSALNVTSCPVRPRCCHSYSAFTCLQRIARPYNKHDDRRAPAY